MVSSSTAPAWTAMSTTDAVQRRVNVCTLPVDTQISSNAGSCGRRMHMSYVKEITIGLKGMLMNVNVIGKVLSNGCNGLTVVALAIATVVKTRPTAEGQVTDAHGVAVGTLHLGPKGLMLVCVCPLPSLVVAALVRLVKPILDMMISLVIGIDETGDAGPTPTHHYFLDELLCAICLARGAIMPRWWGHDPTHALADDARAAAAQVMVIARLELMNFRTKGGAAGTIRNQAVAVTLRRALPTPHPMSRGWARGQCRSGCDLLRGCIYRARASMATAKLRIGVHPLPLEAMQRAIVRGML